MNNLYIQKINIVKLGCGKNSPNNWSNEIIKELSVLLWGIDALDM